MRMRESSIETPMIGVAGGLSIDDEPACQAKYIIVENLTQG